jgi:hypothetical protein
MRVRPLFQAASTVLALVVLSASAQASAPGWSTPHTVTPYRFGTYAAGPNGQAVQIFGNGAVQTMTAQMRAIKSDATEGKSVGVNAGVPGFGGAQVSVNANGRLVAAWPLDTQGTSPIGLAAALGSRSSLPKTAAVLPTDGQSVSAVASAIDAAGNGVVAWIQAPSTGPTSIKAATLRPGQPPQVALLATRADAAVYYISLGLDSAGRPTVTWSVNPNGGTATLIGVARGDGTGAFAPAFEQQLGTSSIATLQTFVTGNGGLLAFWAEEAASGAPQTIKTAQAAPGGTFAAAQTLAGGQPGVGLNGFAVNASGRAAVLYTLGSGGATSLKLQLRTTSGTWGSSRTLGASGRYLAGGDVGVDAKGRVVVLWADGSSSSKGATRVLSARSSSSSDPPSSYNQVSQRSGDKRCNDPNLFLSTSGDGLGLWQCSTSSSGSSFSPRLARLTKP